MKTLITICARGGSKGIPGKNIRQMNGFPLISYSIKVAMQYAEKHNSDIALSTDSIEIKEVANKFGLVTDYIRPDYLASDIAGKMDVIIDILKYQESNKNILYDYILDLDITSPLRTLMDLEEAFNKLVGSEDALNIFSVSPSNRNPYFNMVEETGNGYVKIVKTGATIKSRQQAPQVYDMNASFYFYKRAFFYKGYKTAICDRSLVYLVPHLCFDLDHPHDFTIMEIMLRENLLDFQI